MWRVLADTNVLISAFLTKGNESKVVELAKAGKIKLIQSESTKEEFEETLKYPKLGFSFEQINDAIKEISLITVITPSSSHFDTIKEDLDDNKILEAAFDGNVDYIISGDQHLIKLKEFKGIKIVNAKEFIDTINIDKELN